jgi:cell division protein FtsQ
MTQPALRIYRRKRHFTPILWQWGDSLLVRAFTRSLGCLFLSGTVFFGLAHGNHLDAPYSQDKSLMGRIAPIFGRSAQTIRIAGLKRQSPQKVLAALGIEPGSPLLGFDEDTARKLLENIDWVDQAKVRTVFPNVLEIEIVEREPFAIWQNDGRYYVIDRTGAAMSLPVATFAGNLPLVSGSGAQTAVYELFTQLESHSMLRDRMKAAARVGGRRWTLYFADGVKVVLPEENVEEAMSWIERADAEFGLLSRGIISLDLRLPDRVTIVPQSRNEEMKLTERN